MAKNLMPKIAAMLGVEIGEEFIIQNADRKENVVLAMDGFHVIQPNDVLGPDHGKLLSKVLQGLYEVKKKPWVPKKDEAFYHPDAICSHHPYVVDMRVGCSYWADYNTFYLALKALGMVYRTQQDAEEHLVEDYEKLTGEPFTNR